MIHDYENPENNKPIIMFSKKKKIQKLKRKSKNYTLELLLDEYTRLGKVLIVGKIVSKPLGMILDIEEIIDEFDDSIKCRLDKLKDRLVIREPKIAKKWNQIELVGDRAKRIYFNSEPEMINRKSYCKNYSNGFSETTCDSQCFNCIADIGELKLKRNNIKQ